MEEDNRATELSNVIRMDDKRVRVHLGCVVEGTVEEMPNAMLEARADGLSHARRYERIQAQHDQRSGCLRRSESDAGKLQAKGGPRRLSGWLATGSRLS